MLWWLLLLVPLIPLAWWRYVARQGRPAVPWSTTTAASSVPHGWAARTRWILPLFRTLTILILVIAMVGPIQGDEETSRSVEGVAIELVIDRSGSMQALDLALEGRRVNRLDVVKSVATDFVLGQDQLPGREHDRLHGDTDGSHRLIPLQLLASGIEGAYQATYSLADFCRCITPIASRIFAPRIDIGRHDHQNRCIRHLGLIVSDRPYPGS